MKFVFKYRREQAKGRIVHRPIVKVSLKSTSGCWYTFTAYIDSGADVSMLSRGDAELLGIDIYKGEYWPLMGIGKTLIPAYLHKVTAKIGVVEFPVHIAFADSNEVPRILGRADVFKKFKILFDEQNLQTIFQTYE